MLPQRKTYIYTCYTAHYKYSTIVHATNMKQARIYGLRDARQVMGNHAKIRRDVIQEKT